MKIILHYCIIATIIFSFQLNEASALEPSETPREVRRGSTSFSHDQINGILTLHLRTNDKSEMVFVAVMNSSGSTDMAGFYMFSERLLVNGGSGTFQLDISHLTPGTYILTIHSHSINIEDQLKVI
jgi:hypothetical protein